MSTALTKLDKLLHALTPSERRAARVLLPHVLAGPSGRSSPLGGTRVTIAIPDGASDLGEAVLGALLALPAVQAETLSPEAITVTSLAGEQTITVELLPPERLPPPAVELAMTPAVRSVYDLLVQADEHGVVVADAAHRLDMIGFQVSSALQALRRRGLAFCATERTTARWGITQDAANHALALALEHAGEASSRR